MQTLSVVISAFNEAKHLPDCLQSVAFADEIIVVDNSSTDATGAIAKQYTKHVYTQNNDPGKIDLLKNFGIMKATSDWILILDADERVPKELAEEIRTVMTSGTDTAYRIPRKNIIFNKWIEHSLWWPDPQLRLVKKGKGKYTEETVHKELTVEGTIGMLENPLLHENYQSISQYLQKMDVYTENEAIAWGKEKQRFSWIDAVRMPIRDFLKTFFLQEGYKDGFHGLVLSTLQGFYVFLVIVKVWEKQGFKEEADKTLLPELFQEWKEAQKEISYWFLSGLMQKADPVKRSYYRVKRKYLSRAIRKK